MPHYFELLKFEQLKKSCLDTPYTATAYSTGYNLQYDCMNLKSLLGKTSAVNTHGSASKETKRQTGIFLSEQHRTWNITTKKLFLKKTHTD